MILKIQNHMFNMNCIKYMMKVESKDGKFFIGVFTDIKEKSVDKEFYFEYATLQKRNEDWERIDREFGSSFLYSKDVQKG